MLFLPALVLVFASSGAPDFVPIVLNGNGSPREIHEPLGKTTRMEWAPDDILKTKETDALGRVTEFEYDPRGNLTLERILTPDLGPVVTEYRYGPTTRPTSRPTSA